MQGGRFGVYGLGLEPLAYVYVLMCLYFHAWFVCTCTHACTHVCMYSCSSYMTCLDGGREGVIHAGYTHVIRLSAFIKNTYMYIYIYISTCMHAHTHISTHTHPRMYVRTKLDTQNRLDGRPNCHSKPLFRAFLFLVLGSRRS